MKSLTETFLFKYMNGVSEDGRTLNLRSRMAQYSSPLDDLPRNLLEDELRTIQKRFSFPTKNKVMGDLASERIVPILNKDRVNIPTSVPAYLVRRNNKPAVVVNFTPYVRKNADETELYGDTRQMFALMQTGSILLGCFERWNSISNDQEIAKTGCLVFSKLVSKVIDKLYATNIDPFKADKVRYLAAKYFLLNLLEKADTDNVRHIASTVCKTMTNNAIMNFDQSLPEHGFDDLGTFVELIATYVEGCSSLEFRTFTRVWMQMYQPSTVFALEYLPYFFHMIFSVSVGAHLNNEVVIDSLLGKDIDKLYNAVSNKIR